jgi:signal transduction histidine kinase
MAMIQLTLASELTEEQRENLIIVNDAATSLNSVLSDILDLSKIEANCMELEYAEFSLPLLLDACIASLQLNAKQKGLQLTSNFTPTTPVTVIGDATRLRQILTNLIGNAIKFTHQGGVCVLVKMIAESVGTAKLQFEVKDSGIGVPLEAREKLFEAFTQADGSMTRRFGGTGLGLSICSKLVLLMGGNIWLESQPGQGSTFYFTAVFRTPEQLARGYRDQSTAVLESVGSHS